MALSVGQHSKARGNGTNAATTAAVTTTGGSGSAFLLGIVWYGTSAAPATVTDSKSNTWTQVSSPVTFVSDPVGKAVVYKCLGGTGGATHTVSATFTDSSGGLSLFFVELLGFTSPSINGSASAVDTTNPFASGSVTTTVANAILVGVTGTYQAGNESRAWSGFTEQETYGNGATDFTGGLATQIVSATGTYTAGYTDSATGGNTVSAEAVTWIVAVSDTAIGGGSVTTSRRRPEESTAEERSQRRALIPTSGIAPQSPPPKARRGVEGDAFFLEWDAQQRRRGVPVSGVAPSVPPRLRARTVPDEQIPESLIRRPWLPPTGSAVSPDSPPLVAYDTSDLESGFTDESLQRRRSVVTSGAAVAALPPFTARRGLLDELAAPDIVPEREGPAQLRASDAPPLRRTPVLGDEAPPPDVFIEREEPAPLTGAAPQTAPIQRRASLDAPQLDDVIVVREGPAPLTSSAPQAPAPLRRAVQVGFDESLSLDTVIAEREGPSPLRATDAAPPARARSAAGEESAQDERQRRISAPTSGVAPSNPPSTRARPVADEQSPETLVRRPWLPVSGVAPSAAPVARARAISDELATEQPQRRPFAPDTARVDAPPPARPRATTEESFAEDRIVFRASPPAAPAQQASTPLRPRRTLSDEQSADPASRRPWLPAAAPPPSPPPTTRARPISDEQFPETLQRKPWTAVFGRVDAPPVLRAYSLSRAVLDEYPEAERAVRSFAALLARGTPTTIIGALVDYRAPLVDLTRLQFTAPLVDLTNLQFTAALVDTTAAQFTAAPIDCRP
jgi:hypothetical protein